MSYKDVVVELLGNSSLIAKKHFGKVTSSVKPGDNNQVLTETDLEIGSYLVGKIQEFYPEHNIIDEESGTKDNKSEYTWVIDPIDGTSNFAMGLPMYGIIIGLLNKGVPVAGGVALPFFGELYYAEKGKGAYRNNDSISVTKETSPIKTLVAYGIDSHQDNPDFTKKELTILGNIINNIQNLRCSNSVYDAMMVASGKFGAYINQRMRIWDVVGPQVIIEEAGGIVTDFYGSELDYSDPVKKAKEHFTYFSASSSLYPQLLKLTK